ncbi:hypothetical protein VPDG_00067 [Vibrio phage henriette 12B8]|uniref:hypothetical protein n=1 Tax=Vibrio phage henriette 12B8 TaxID=573174 RepID=UPI0002C105ED|nr:hypothetical protein VPDG_00067 [Vibrio phage henriette 12B8]AGG58228.1 hypothetical protein VPDG_00067 [Vibrio phage henriette 12B8]
MIYVTINQIKDADPTNKTWRELMPHGCTINDSGDNQILLSSILDVVDLKYTMWVIDNVDVMRKYDGIWRKFIAWRALLSIDSCKLYCSEHEHTTIKTYLINLNEMLMRDANKAAYDTMIRARQVAKAARVRSVEGGSKLAMVSAKEARYARDAARAAVKATNVVPLVTFDVPKNGTKRNVIQTNKLRELLNSVV